MASRRDELNAYTFAKKRLLAAFLQPTPSGTEEGAPRPLRAVVPGVIIGVVILAAFGAWGMFKPKAPKGWDNVAEKVIIGSESTTRYVVLDTDGEKQLHPVLNLASAKLLLKPSKYEIVEVDEETLDGGKIPHGATIGIPYAPDRLPDGGEATQQKTWAVCTQPGGGGSVQKAVFVFADREKKEVGGEHRLRRGEVMYVQGPDDRRFIVGRSGARYLLEPGESGDSDTVDLLTRALVGTTEPQQVTSEWLNTLEEGDTVKFPEVPGFGDPADVAGSLEDEVSRVGMVLKAQSGSGPQHYVVLADEVRPITPFVADLLLSSAQSPQLGQQGEAREVSAGAIVPVSEFWGKENWPTEEARVVNPAEGERDTLCNVLRSFDKEGTRLSTWAGENYPKQLPNGATSAYVTPGSGLLFRQVKGGSLQTGGVFLVTDTGLRYAVQGNKDSGQDDAGIGESEDKKQKQRQEGNRAQIRLGYEKAEPVPVPAAWSTFLPTGPRLSTTAARQPQGS
jgi:type VII secretion protein EccB